MAGLPGGGSFCRTVGFLVVVYPDLGFGGAQAAFDPLAVNEVVDQGSGFWTGGVVAPVPLVDQLLKVGEVFGGEEQGLGVDGGFEGVRGRDGLACDRGGAGGFLRVTTVRFDLAKGGHVLCGSGIGQAGGLSYFEDKWRDSGISR
jgi:hypothetical protein